MTQVEYDEMQRRNEGMRQDLRKSISICSRWVRPVRLQRLVSGEFGAAIVRGYGACVSCLQRCIPY